MTTESPDTHPHDFETAEAIVVHLDGEPVLDLDPAQIARVGALASVWDQRLMDLMASAFAFMDDTDFLKPVRIVWADTRADVMVLCPTCSEAKFALPADMPQFGFVNAHDDDCLVCVPCSFRKP